ncbi:MAG: DNA translocase FtsK [Thermoleophilia bacterium]
MSRTPDDARVASGWNRHRGELAALACLGAAAFLSYVLVARETGGFLGDVGGSALTVALGRLGFLLPLALLAVAAKLVLDFRVRWNSVWVWGIVACVAGIALLTAAGFPPVGSGHQAPTFVREVYKHRAGWLGEAAYAATVALTGGVGVGIAGWLLLVAGVSLVTGVTIRRFASGTGHAARAAQAGAQQHTRRLRQRNVEGGSRPGSLDDPYLSGFGPPADDRHHPPAAPAARRDEGWPEQESLRFSAGAEWEGPSPRAPAPTRRDLLDGAAAFPDIYTYHDVPGGAGGGAGQHAETSSAAQAAGTSVDMSGPHSRKSSDADTTMGPLAGRQQPLPGLDDPRVAPAHSEADASSYALPGVDLLKKSALPVEGDGRPDRETAHLLVETLSNFGVDARVVGMVVGPRVTRFELQLAPGTKVSKVSGLKDDLAYALASTEIRILAPIPGKQAVGVEVPNQRPTFVTLGDIYRDFPRSAGPLMVWLGKDISGKPVYTDLGRLPHLLIAGTTGSGKSGCVNCIISSILLRASPDQVKLILIDPKKVELSHYDYVPHLLVPVVTNMKNAAGVLHNIVKEMENRYELMELERARNLDEANKARLRRGERPLPYVVVVIDELADLMMVSPAQVEEYIIRLAQKARAVGIHLVVATQRPSVDVITGMIKANIPSRIAFAVSSQTDSRVILDTNGAEALLGLGDMLFRPLGSNRLQRIQGAFITEEEIHRLVTHCRRQAEPEYQEELLEAPKTEEKSEDEEFDPDSDDLLEHAAEMVLETGSASVSMLQRRLRVGYTRAGRLIDMLERRGIVGPYEGSKARQILVRPGEKERILESFRSEGGRGLPSEPDDFENPDDL